MRKELNNGKEWPPHKLGSFCARLNVYRRHLCYNCQLLICIGCYFNKFALPHVCLIQTRRFFRFFLQYLQIFLAFYISSKGCLTPNSRYDPSHYWLIQSILTGDNAPKGISPVRMKFIDFFDLDRYVQVINDSYSQNWFFTSRNQKLHQL